MDLQAIASLELTPGPKPMRKRGHQACVGAVEKCPRLAEAVCLPSPASPGPDYGAFAMDVDMDVDIRSAALQSPPSSPNRRRDLKVVLAGNSPVKDSRSSEIRARLAGAAGVYATTRARTFATYCMHRTSSVDFAPAGANLAKIPEQQHYPADEYLLAETLLGSGDLFAPLD